MITLIEKLFMRNDGRAYVCSGGDGRDISIPRQRQEGTMLPLWQSLYVSFVRIDKYAGNKKSYSQYYKSSAQDYWQPFKEITGETYGEDSFAHIGSIFSNKLHTGFIDIWQNKFNLSYHPVFVKHFVLLKVNEINRGGWLRC